MSKTEDATKEESPAAVVVAPSIPFEDIDDPSKDFEVTAPIDLGRLRAEIVEALGHSAQVVVTHTDRKAGISKKNPSRIYVSAPKDFDGRTVRGVIAKHDPSPSEEQQALRDNMQALKSGKDLSLKDLNAVVRRLLR